MNISCLAFGRTSKLTASLRPIGDTCSLKDRMGFSFKLLLCCIAFGFRIFEVERLLGNSQEFHMNGRSRDLDPVIYVMIMTLRDLPPQSVGA